MFRFVCRGWNCAPYINDCISSIQKQTISEWTATLILDPGEDNSIAIAKQLAARDSRLEVFSNTNRMGVCYNMWHGINFAGKDPDDIICTVDLDDMIVPTALEVVRDTYAKNHKAMCTYGSFITTNEYRNGWVNHAYGIGEQANRIRKIRWHASHLKTFKFGIMKHIPKEYFMHKGQWGLAASDFALMFSIIETVGLPSCIHIRKQIYIYRCNTSITLNRGTQLKWAKIFRKKKPLERKY